MPLNLEALAQTKQQLIILIAAFILFILAIIFGIMSGRWSAKANADYQNVMHLNAALNYYFSDQDRYPSADEFYNQKILVPQYLTSMPIVAGTGGVCAGYDQYFYSQSEPARFSLKFCLLKPVASLSKGPHELTEAGIQ